jgi:hypothetical protein
MSEARERELLAALLRDLPGYTPELAPREAGAAFALLQSFARLDGILEMKLARLPQRNLLAGLDMLGVNLLPAQAARAPLVFSLQDDAPVDVTLPAGSQVAAKPAPAPPQFEAAAVTVTGEPVVFATERNVTLARAKLAALYSVDPGADRYADHATGLASGFALFEDMVLTPHHLYVGHDTLFKLGGRISLIFSFIFEHAAREPVGIVWEYFTDAGWFPLPARPEEDTTGGWIANGQVTVQHECGPNAKQTSVAGRTSYWLRARLETPLLREGIAPLITLNDLRVRASIGKSALKLDAAFAGSQSVDVSKDFLPFGQIPARGTAFMLACKDAFSRPGANVKIDFTLSGPGTTRVGDDNDSFALTWEYSTADGWRELSLREGASAMQFTTASQFVAFTSPRDWRELEVNGVKHHWLRVRITGGDFGKPIRVLSLNAVGQPSFSNANLKPPMIKTVAVSFEVLTDPEPLQHCVTYNDFVYRDCTEAALWPDQSFVPFTPVEDTTAAVHLGFDRALPRGLVSLFLDVPDAPPGSQAASPYLWEYRAKDGWKELAVLDETIGFIRRGMIQFIGPPDGVAIKAQRDRPLYWLRARTKLGESPSGGPSRGLWLNAMWSAERQRSERELVGRGDGNPRQTFPLRRAPVLSGEVVEVEEWVGRGEAWRNALNDVDEQDIRFERDPATQVPLSAWVLWRERQHFFESGPRDRHYVLERATGMLRFGSGAPAAGRRVAVSYSSGGGLGGNVATGAAKELRLATPYLTGATNVLAAQGGAEAETRPRVLRRGPQHLRHRGRGISAQDLEWLALEASPEVARARCLPLEGPDGHAQRGWMSLMIVPRSADARPEPNGELVRVVRDFLAARMTAGARLRVLSARFQPVAVRGAIVPVAADSAALIEARVRSAVDRYLHPLVGGRDGDGWDFGADVHLSQLAEVIEGVDGVEHAEDLLFSSDGALAGMSLESRRDSLVCAGEHEFVMHMGAG